MKIIDVVGAVIVKDGRIYASQRGYGEFKDGWEFPGGKVEANETSQDALKREIEEELDTVIEVGESIGQVEYDYPKFTLHMKLFICSILKGDLTMLEAEDERWLTLETLDSVEWLPADVAALDLVRKYFSNK